MKFHFNTFIVEFTHTFRGSFRYLARISEGVKIGTWRQFAAARPTPLVNAVSISFHKRMWEGISSES